MDRTNNQSGRPARSKQRGEMRGWTDKATTPPRAGAAQARTPVVCLSCRRVFTSQHALGGHMPCTARAEDSSDGSFTFSGEESSSSDARPPPRQRTCIRPPAQDFPVAMPLPVIGQMVVSRPSSAELLRTGGVSIWTPRRLGSHLRCRGQRGCAEPSTCATYSSGAHSWR